MKSPSDTVAGSTFQVGIGTVGTELVIKLRGHLDGFAAEDLRSSIARLETVARGGGAVVDLTELSFCDVAGLNVLVALHARLAERYARVVFEGIQPQVHLFMRAVHIDGILDPASTTR